MLLDRHGMERELLWAWLEVMVLLVAGGKAECGGGHTSKSQCG